MRAPAVLLAGACGLLALAPPATAATVPFQRGMTVGEWGRTAYQPERTARVMRSLARRHHADSVTLFVVWTQKHPAATVIAPGAKTARLPNLVRAIRSARAAGLRVILRPYVDVADGSWRGAIEPSSLKHWFGSYRRFIFRYAELARREHAAGFVVGTEMVSVSWAAREWRSLIAAVRERFDGFVTYQANWDEATRIRFWDRLDAVSVSAYYPLVRAPGASVEALVAGWRDWATDLRHLYRTTRKPVMFGEIGYRTVDRAAVAPWAVEPAAFSLEAQQRAYEAALRVWYRVRWFAGFHWWYLAPHAALLAGRRGADHRPAGPTLSLVGDWYSKPRGDPR